MILTPHIGGSTQEAQENIGFEVAGKMVKYSDNGSTLSAVNFPEVSLPEHKGRSRLLHIHKNQPGMLTKINEAFAKHGINISGQYLQTNAEIGYVVIDIDSLDHELALNELKAIPGTLRAGSYTNQPSYLKPQLCSLRVLPESHRQLCSWAQIRLSSRCNSNYLG